MSDYLPEDATIEQSCAWLEAETGETWILPRLLECHLTPYFWIDYKAGYPVIFGDRIEGYQSRMMFQGDMTRLKSDGADALVNMFAAHDGTLIKAEPGLRVPLSDLRFKRDRVKRVAQITNNSKQPQHQAPPEPDATPWHLLATPAELIAAFGTFTGMNKAWFNNANDAPKLMAARHSAGQGGRMGREPLFFVFPIMQWLIDEKRRKGKPMTGVTGWRVLKNKFPKVYEECQGQEPDAD